MCHSVIESTVCYSVFLFNTVCWTEDLNHKQLYLDQPYLTMSPTPSSNPKSLVVHGRHMYERTRKCKESYCAIGLTLQLEFLASSSLSMIKICLWRHVFVFRRIWTENPAVTKPLISRNNQKAGLSFAGGHVVWKENWSKVQFSKFNLFESDGRLRRERTQSVNTWVKGIEMKCNGLVVFSAEAVLTTCSFFLPFIHCQSDFLCQTVEQVKQFHVNMNMMIWPAHCHGSM